MEAQEFDLVVIGSGPAGEKGAAQAAYFGKKVALIEKENVLGGAAANTGTLPSKTLRESALYLSGYRQRGLHGVSLSVDEGLTARDLLFRERLVVQSEHARITENIKRHKVALYRGRASLVDAHTVAITPDNAAPAHVRGEVILIAAGSAPYRPDGIPFHDSRDYDSDTVLNIHDMPKRLLIAGGGVIGCEYACLFSALGIAVSLVEGRDRLVGFMDTEISSTLTEAMRAMGIELHMSDTIESVEAGEAIVVHLKSGAAPEVDTVLAATGRTGNTRGMGLEELGVELGQRGAVKVNEHYQTSVPNISTRPATSSAFPRLPRRRWSRPASPWSTPSTSSTKQRSRTFFPSASTRFRNVRWPARPRRG